VNSKHYKQIFSVGYSGTLDGGSLSVFGGMQ